jgi:restriction system protein
MQDPESVLADMKALTPLARDVYARLLDTLSATDGMIPDHAADLARRCRCGPKQWGVVRARLIRGGLLKAGGGMLWLPDKAVAALPRSAARKSKRASKPGPKRRAARRAPGDRKRLKARLVAALPALKVLRAQARAAIEEHLRALGPYEMQELAAALLEAMGWLIAEIAPPGPDGGTDILARRDPLGADTPHLRVQVKHWTGPAGRDEIANLRGILAPGREIGLFVSTGGFTREARREARQAGPPITLMDLDGFLPLWVRYERQLAVDARARLRLAPVWLLES